MKNLIKHLVSGSLCALMVCAFVSVAQAQDKKADGTWTWTMQGRNGGPDRKMTLKLKTEGEKVTGKLTMPAFREGGDPSETEITDGKIKNGEVSFTVTRERNGNKMVTKYNGKLSGDTIKGKTEFERNGETQSRDWEAKRDTEKK